MPNTDKGDSLPALEELNLGSRSSWNLDRG